MRPAAHCFLVRFLCGGSIFLFAVLAAIDLFLRICQEKDMRQLLFDGGDASGIMTMDHILDLAGKHQFLQLRLQWCETGCGTECEHHRASLPS